MIKYLTAFVLSVIVMSFLACGDDIAVTPKPRMFPRVFYPTKSMATYNSETCPFTFNYLGYNKILKDTFIFEGKPMSDCWFDVHSKDLNASLHCSYYGTNGSKSISTHIDDAFRIAGNHNTKANYRKEDVISNKYGVKGLLFSIEGPVASPIQFYLTDNDKHFFRASLYFNSKVNPDSTAAVLEYIKPDIDSLISSFRWKN
jgi:gliding motility-associated lipoprotein GldD